MAGDAARTARHCRSIRLKGCDYSRVGAYFITICTQNHISLFGDVIGEDMRLNDAGRMVQSARDGLPHRFSDVKLDAFVVMPNHIHGNLRFERERHVDGHLVAVGVGIERGADERTT